MSILQLEGAYENELAATGEFNPHAPKTALRLPSGERLVLPTEVLLAAMGRVSGAEEEATPSAEIRARMDEARAAEVVPEGLQERATATSAVGAREQVISLVEEQLVVGKTEVETGRVKVRRETEEYQQTVTVPLTDVRWEVEHVPIEQRVEAQPEMRQVGDTIIFPLVEERLVVSRELWLREEVHVRRVKSTVEKSADFSLKRDVLVEQRSGSERP